MTRLPSNSWKFWKKPAASKRWARLGIDYGTSTSKIVCRVCSGDDTALNAAAVLVVRDGSSRIPSRVCVTPAALLFGEATTAASATCQIFESIKTRLTAAEPGRTPAPNAGSPALLLAGFTAADLAALTVWFLISEGHRTAAADFGGTLDGIEVQMTLGVPQACFSDPARRTVFLGIARRAWSFYKKAGLTEASLPIEKAQSVLAENPSDATSNPEDDFRRWIRSEDEAAVWFCIHAPSCGAAPYAKVEIGAGYTQVSLFRVFGNVHTVKRSRVPYGAASVPVGTAAADYGMAPVAQEISAACRQAWSEACSKMSSNGVELSAWQNYRIFLLGGGSFVPPLVDAAGMHPGHPEQPLTVMPREQPRDLRRADRRTMTAEELAFVAVAYGLSYRDFELPNPYCRDVV